MKRQLQLITDLANLYYNAERFIEAAKLYQKSIEHGIEGADAYFMLAKSFEREGQSKISIAVYATCCRTCTRRCRNSFSIWHYSLYT